MDRNMRWKYILLGVGVFLVVIVLVYLQVAAHFHVPVASLLPSGPRPLSIPAASPTPTEEPAPPPVQRVTLTNGTVLYIITGEFVTAPAYNTQQVLQGDFVIGNDPTHIITVVMTGKTDKITVGRFKGSFNGKIVVGLEDTESLRQSITAHMLVQLRISSPAPAKSANDILDQKVMDSIIAGIWSIPKGFILHTSTVDFVLQ